MVLLVISGHPATGKSTFTRWLRDAHGYHRLASDEPGWSGEAVLSALEKFPNVVLDYAIPVDSIQGVAYLATRGFEVWWFSGDPITTREVFLERAVREPDHPATIVHYERYVGGVEANWPLYQSLFGDRFIEVLRPGPWHMPNEERLAIIQSYARAAP